MDSICTLVGKIKATKFKQLSDLLLVNDLSDLILDEWLKMKNQHYKKQLCKKNNLGLYMEQEAEREILIGLLFLLNEKMSHFVCSLKI